MTSSILEAPKSGCSSWNGGLVSFWISMSCQPYWEGLLTLHLYVWHIVQLWGNGCTHYRLTQHGVSLQVFAEAHSQTSNKQRTKFWHLCMLTSLRMVEISKGSPKLSPASCSLRDVSSLLAGPLAMTIWHTQTHIHHTHTHTHTHTNTTSGVKFGRDYQGNNMSTN